MPESRTLSVYIDRPWQEVYELIWRPEMFPRWASGLSQSALEKDGDVWKAQGPGGRVRIRFTDHNAFGVMDHYVDVGGGVIVQVPLRVVAHGEGAEVMLTLFRLKGMTDAQYAADADTITRDLAALAELARQR